MANLFSSSLNKVTFFRNMLRDKEREKVIYLDNPVFGDGDGGGEIGVENDM